MSELKKHNSIIFLTTLSVYLGLVLVGGASSPILAQAALTRNFDIQEEIEYKDDLDKNPDDELVSSILGIVDSLHKSSKQESFDWKNKAVYEVENLKFDEGKDFPSFDFSILCDSTIETEVFKNLDKNIFNVAKHIFAKESSLGLGYFYSHRLDFRLFSENNSLDLTFKVTNGNESPANVFADSLTKYFDQAALNPKSTKEKVVIENTKVTFENNQVFIITNLPRASIDSLLADKNAI